MDSAIAHQLETSTDRISPPKLEDPDQRRSNILLSALTIYAVLWILEGALRKWVPWTSSSLYFARDLILLAMLGYSALVAPQKSRRILGQLFWGGSLLLILYGLLQAIVLNLPLAVVIAGARAMIAPWLPLYIVLRHRPPGVWRRLAVLILLVAPIEALLTIGQSTSPAGALINRQIGNEDAYFSTSGGVVRGSGTFTSPIGLSMFVTVCLGVALAEVSRRRMPKRLRLPFVGLISVAIILLFGGSRGALLSTAIVGVFFALHIIANRGIRGAPQLVIIAALIGATVLIGTHLLPDVVAAFGVRIESASDSDNIDSRLIGTALGFLSTTWSGLGDGLGSHTQIGIALGSGQPWIESENSRWAADLGVLGYLMALTRIAAGLVLAIWLIVRVRRIPVIAGTMGIIIVPLMLYGSLTTQPTVQGSVGVTLAIMASAYVDTLSGASRRVAPHRADNHGQLCTLG